MRLTTIDGSNTVTGKVTRELMVGYWFQLDGDTKMGDRYFSKDDWTLEPGETGES